MIIAEILGLLYIIEVVSYCLDDMIAWTTRILLVSLEVYFVNIVGNIITQDGPYYLK